MNEIDTSRAATVEEKAVVRWLLTNAATNGATADLLSQVDHLLVVGGCTCGCPSVDFEQQGQAAGASIVADAIGADSNGMQVGVIAWSRAGLLSGLEAYATAQVASFSLPRVDTLRPWESGLRGAP